MENSTVIQKAKKSKITVNLGHGYKFSKGKVIMISIIEVINNRSRYSCKKHLSKNQIGNEKHFVNKEIK